MKTITLTDEQYQALQRGESITIEPPKQKWEPKGGEWYISGGGTLGCTATDNNYRMLGNEYATSEQAERELPEIRMANRARAYRREFAPDCVVPPAGERAWCVWIDANGRAVADWHRVRVVGAVFMPQDVAKQLAADINSGRVEL